MPNLRSKSENISSNGTNTAQSQDTCEPAKVNKPTTKRKAKLTQESAASNDFGIDNQDQKDSKPTEIKVGRIVTSNLFDTPFWHKMNELELQLSAELAPLMFPKDVAAVYNPLVYAAELHSHYLSKYLDGPKKIMFLGMNPGPFGMCQTSVPFGHVPSVRDWMKLEGNVNKPDNELAARPVEGLSCVREEISGQRWWGLMKKICDTPENFFKHCFVYNYCPLALFKANGCNITPAEIKGDTKGKLQEICTRYLKDVINLIQPETIVCIGRYIEDRVKDLKKQNVLDEKVKVLYICHPSPRAINNTNWVEKAEDWFNENDLIKYLKP